MSTFWAQWGMFAIWIVASLIVMIGALLSMSQIKIWRSK